MPESRIVEVRVPEELGRCRMPEGLQARLQALLDQQDAGTPLTDAERSEAEGLVTIADFHSILRLRTERAA